MGFAGGAPFPTGALPHLQSPAGVDGVDDGDSDNLFCGGVRFKCYTLHLSSTELNIQCVPKISCSQNFEDSAGKSNFWAKVVQIGLNMSRNLVSQHHSQNYVGSLFGTSYTWQPVLMNANHNTNRDFDFPDDEPASTNSKLPKTTDAVDNMERSTGMDSWTLEFRKDSFGIVVRKT